MQHLFLVIFTFLSALNVYAYPSYGPGKVSVGKYQKPGKGDQRCVCPALNTLSNYGYL